MDNWANRRVIDDGEPPIAAAPQIRFTNRDFHEWRVEIEHRPAIFDTNLAWGTGYSGGMLAAPEFQLDGSIYQSFTWTPEQIKKAWAMAWPDHPKNENSDWHTVDDQ